MSNLLRLCNCWHEYFLKVILVLLSFNVFDRIKVWEDLNRIVVEELLGWRELACDSLDDFLGDVTSEEGGKWVEHTLALEGKRE